MGMQPVYKHRASQKHPEPALLLCCFHVKILNFLARGPPHIHFALGSTNYVSGTDCPTLFLMVV